MPVTETRPYDAERDLQAVTRIWREIAWIDSSDGAAQALEAFMSCGHTNVGLIDGEAECSVHWTPGTMHHLAEPVPLCAITAVTTSRIGRKRGFASTLTAIALAEGAAAGAGVAALGMFEQGFYNRLGFATGGYDHMYRLDPRALRVETPYRTPVRLSQDDWRDIHAAMLDRKKGHGAVTLDPPEITQADLGWTEDFFGLGYRDDGRLTHFVVGSAKGEHGPYKISMYGYQTTGQLMELLRLIHELADQLASVEIVEPREIQLQDLMVAPNWQQLRTAQSPHETQIRAWAWWQLRILDLVGCLAKVHLPGPDVVFNLRLTDPLAELPGAPWPGVGGDYTVTLGAWSNAEAGHSAGLPTLRAGVGAFSRLVYGVRPAASLALTYELDGPPELLQCIDRTVLLPPPHTGLDF